MAEKKNIDVSIIIPLYKGKKYCTRLMGMIEKNCLYNHLFDKCKVEIIFVNDYPKERIVIEKLDRVFEVLLINLSENRGIHAARIEGVNAARGEYVIMLDQDDLVSEEWLCSQWYKITNENLNYCVCNGWIGRFRVFCEENVLMDRVNKIDYYLTTDNAICSPGQVIIRRKSFPEKWFKNIQKCNGSDDFLLWVMVLKKGERFGVNEKYLYYHTPERNLDSINLNGMIKSLKETAQILSAEKMLNVNEIEMLNRQIEEKSILNRGEDSESLKLSQCVNVGNYFKFKQMLCIMLEWMKLRNRGGNIAYFLEKNNYMNVAIYGMGHIGECLYDELYRSKINIMYGIDRSAKDFRKELPIYKFEDQLYNVDMVIITVADGTEKIVKKVQEKLNCMVMTISEMLVRINNAE